MIVVADASALVAELLRIRGRKLLAHPDLRVQAPTEAGRTQVDAATLRQLQAPLKERYRSEPDSAVVTLSAAGELDGTGVACRVRTARALVAPAASRSVFVYPP